MDFTLERIKYLSDRPFNDKELLIEIAYLYDREVKNNIEQPIKMLASILEWELHRVPECVSEAIEEQYLIRNRENGAWKVSTKALRALHLKGKQFV